MPPVGFELKISAGERPYYMAETMNNTVLENTNTVQLLGSETFAYRTAALNVNNRKCIVTDRLKEFNLWNYYCQLNEKTFEHGSGRTKESHTV
jgi:hypothetical protein